MFTAISLAAGLSWGALNFNTQERRFIFLDTPNECSVPPIFNPEFDSSKYMIKCERPVPKLFGSSIENSNQKK